MMSLPLSFLPGAALSGLAGAMTQMPSADLTAWQREMAHAVAQAGFQHPSLLHQYQHGQDDTDAGTRRVVKRPSEPEIAATPACPLLPPLLPSTLPRFAAISALPELAMPVAAHQKPVCSFSALPAPPVRLHAEWAAQGVMVWLGANAAATPSTPQLTQQIKHWLGEHGVQLLGLVCNGKSLYSARTVSERKAPHGEAPPGLQDCIQAFHLQET